jgi:large subunit ribosomal protein L21
MYAVVTSGGKQYRVEPGAELLVERLAGEPGAAITFERVLLFGDGDRITVGTPTVDGVTVRATVLAEERGPKLLVFKYRPKARYRRRMGHRQHLTRVRIDVIETPDGKREAAARRRRAEKTATDTAPAETAPVETAPAETAPAETSPDARDAAESKPRRRGRATSRAGASETATKTEARGETAPSETAPSETAGTTED